MVCSKELTTIRISMLIFLRYNRYFQKSLGLENVHTHRSRCTTEGKIGKAQLLAFQVHEIKVKYQS